MLILLHFSSTNSVLYVCPNYTSGNLKKQSLVFPSHLLTTGKAGGGTALRQSCAPQRARTPRPNTGGMVSLFRHSFSLWERAKTARKRKCCDLQKGPLTNPLRMGLRTRLCRFPCSFSAAAHTGCCRSRHRSRFLRAAARACPARRSCRYRPRGSHPRPRSSKAGAR